VTAEPTSGARPYRRDSVDLPELVHRAVAGESWCIARLISLVEDQSHDAADIARMVTPHARGAHVVGLTGAPGVGKSTITSALVAELRERDLRVAVVAVDPSSPFTGGALLGDRLRMQDHSGDDGVFIRSLASRGHLGGLASAARQTVRILDAAGFDVVLVETVGVGQSEVEVSTIVDTTVVLLAPGMGDGIQAAKAGLLEIADLYVVNKADNDGADDVLRDLRAMIALSRRGPGAWRPKVLKSTATQRMGIDEMTDAFEAHRAWLDTDGESSERRRARAEAEVTALALEQLIDRFRISAAARVPALATEVVAGSVDPWTAAAALVDKWRSEEA
jgi:LAO/AO transport system kinase